jgi:hypothetical protein
VKILHYIIALFNGLQQHSEQAGSVVALLSELLSQRARFEFRGAPTVFTEVFRGFPHYHPVIGRFIT